MNTVLTEKEEQEKWKLKQELLKVCDVLSSMTNIKDTEDNMKDSAKASDDSILEIRTCIDVVISPSQYSDFVILGRKYLVIFYIRYNICIWYTRLFPRNAYKGRSLC